MAVPHAYFCVLARGSLEAPEVMGFIVENTTQKLKWKEAGRSEVVQVSRIEELAGFDFLNRIRQPLQSQLESTPATLWTESQPSVFPHTAQYQAIH